MTELPLYMILKDVTRQKIIQRIGEKGIVTYSGLLSFLKVSTGKLNYHLKILTPFLNKGDQGYSLNEDGKNAFLMLLKFDSRPSGRVEKYRPLSWVILPLSLILILIDNIYVETLGISFLFIGVFFFYISGNTEMKTWESVATLAFAFVAGSFATVIGLIVYPPVTFTLNGLHVSLLVIAYSLVFFSTMVPWSLTSEKRWIAAVALMLSVTLFFFFGTLLSILTVPSGWSSLSSVMVLPGIFLLATALSKAFSRMNSHEADVTPDKFS